MIQVSDLTKYYAAFPAVRDISFQVEPGEVVGFLGPNGAGKTTTLRILSGYMPATRGRVIVAGFDVVTQSRQVRQRTGYLPEDVPLYLDLTVTAYLAHIATLKEIPRKAVRGEVERVIGLVGLEAMRDKLVGKCSKGYRQRTGLAQALLGDPEVLLLDEPTSGLDPNQVVEVRNLIRDLSGHKTVLLSTHILSEVKQICNRVLIIHDGRLVGTGTPEHLAEAAGDTRLTLRARGPVTAQALLEVPGVRGAESLDNGLFELRVDDAERTAPRVAAWVISRKAELLELKSHPRDLEAVFRALTVGEEDRA